MNKRIPGILTALFCAALLAACGSSPRNNYYLLSAEDVAAPGGSEPSVGIGPVTVPEYLARDNLVYKRAGNKLHVSDTEQWAEPLTDGIARVLALNLAAELDTQSIRLLPWDPQRRPDYAVKVNVLGLDADSSEATLVVEWLVYRPGDSSAVERRISNLAEPLGGAGGVEAIPPAYSRLLKQLSREIATAINAVP